ncbi:MAG TPA: succinate dehydrogenase, hydrophobic membrane anchor protein [Rudaea sp.]|jgi:succinate dehydrogenase / fumarate reductase membrane anchor subunit|nr:succinate dehydrogenase, hydrophobic membrane anchor protein [Rudaea sp.]
MSGGTPQHSDLQTPLKRVRGWGSSRSGTHHFIVQRITAVALVPLAIWFVWFVLTLVHSDYAHARAALHHPIQSLLMIVFIGAAFWHAQLGLQVVIEDYVHTTWLEVTTQLLIKFLCVIGAVAAILAVIRVALA